MLRFDWNTGTRKHTKNVAHTDATTRSSPPSTSASRAPLLHSLLLGERLYLFARLRFVAAGGILLGGLFATHVVGVQGLRVGALAACAAFLAAYNVVVLWFVRPYRNAEAEKTTQGYHGLIQIAHGTIFLDYLVLTCAIWLVGGSQSPFLAFYLLHAVLASVLLSRQAAFVHALLGYLMLAGIVLGEWWNWIPRNRPIGAVPGGLESDILPALTTLFAYGLMTIVATYLVTGIARLLREGERRLRAASEEIESLANMRRSFLHVALHDLRSPIDTVVTLLDNLTSGLGGPLNETQADWVRRADVRLRGVLDLLRDLQILAKLETSRIEAVMEPIDLARLIRDVVEDHADLAQQRALSLKVELATELAPVRGVDRLVREALANYLTNAAKYANGGGNVVVRAKRERSHVRIEVADDGPGISSTDQERLFQEFARVAKHGEGRGAVPGTGLGLSIARRIAEAHGGHAGVVSEVGKGSCFFLEIPISPDVH